MLDSCLVPTFAKNTIYFNYFARARPLQHTELQLVGRYSLFLIYSTCLTRHYTNTVTERRIQFSCAHKLTTHWCTQARQGRSWFGCS